MITAHKGIDAECTVLQGGRVAVAMTRLKNEIWIVGIYVDGVCVSAELQWVGICTFLCEKIPAGIVKP